MFTNDCKDEGHAGLATRHIETGVYQIIHRLVRRLRLAHEDPVGREAPLLNQCILHRRGTGRSKLRQFGVAEGLGMHQPAAQGRAIVLLVNPTGCRGPLPRGMPSA